MFVAINELGVYNGGSKKECGALCLLIKLMQILQIKPLEQLLLFKSKTPLWVVLMPNNKMKPV